MKNIIKWAPIAIVNIVNPVRRSIFNLCGLSFSFNSAFEAINNQRAKPNQKGAKISCGFWGNIENITGIAAVAGTNITSTQLYSSNKFCWAENFFLAL